MILAGCNSGSSPSTDPDPGDEVPPDSIVPVIDAAPAPVTPDPGLEGSPFELSDPSCTELSDQIQCTNVVYSIVNPGQTETRLHLDLHLPLAAKTARVPTIVFLHPGGWSVGSYHALSQLQLASYLARGYAVVSVEYRLTLNPDHSVSGITFPDNLKDVKTAVRWLRIKAGAFVDPDRLMAYGVSAGAHLAALVGATSSVVAFDGRGDPSVSTAVKAVVGISTPSDFHLFKPRNPPLADTCPSQPPGQDPQQGVSWLLGVASIDDATEEALTTVSTLPYLDTSSPPMQFFAGTCDQTVPYQGVDVSLRSRMQELGLSQIHVFISPNAFHGTTLQAPQAQATLDAFVASQLDP